MWKNIFREHQQKNVKRMVVLALLATLLALLGIMTAYIISSHLSVLSYTVPTLNSAHSINTTVLETELYLSVTSAKAYRYSRGKKFIKKINVEAKEIYRLNPETLATRYIASIIKMTDEFLEKKNTGLRQIRKVIKEVKVNGGRILEQTKSERDKLLGTSYMQVQYFIYSSFGLSVIILLFLMFGTVRQIFILRKNIKNFDKLVASSMIDEESGLYNKYYLEQRIVEQIQKYLRFKTPFSVLVMKICDLKAVYPVFTHNLIVSESAKRLRKATRVYDVNTRFDEDLFAVLLQDVDEDRTRIIAGRLKEVVEKRKISGDIINYGKRLWNLFKMKKPEKFSTHIKVNIIGVVYKGGEVGASDILEYAKMLIDSKEPGEDYLVETIKKHRKLMIK